jgi:endogenous inhibitor of DNA gyrase (YacG/DUF329 family)
VGGWAVPESETPSANWWRASVHCPRCQRELAFKAPLRAVAASVWLWANAQHECPKCGPVTTRRKTGLIFGSFPELRPQARGIAHNDNNDEKETGT